MTAAGRARERSLLDVGGPLVSRRGPLTVLALAVLATGVVVVLARSAGAGGLRWELLLAPVAAAVAAALRPSALTAWLAFGVLALLCLATAASVGLLLLPPVLAAFVVARGASRSRRA